MARADRLFRLMTEIRSLPKPVTATRLASETGVSARTLYRDIEALRAGGALIDGAAGVGYTLTEDPALPPQLFSQLEIEALVLGLSEVRHMGDTALTRAAEVALSKIIATLPQRIQRQAAHAVSRSVRFNARNAAPPHINLLRTAMWDERAVQLRYSDRADSLTTREIWPLAIVYFDNALMCLAHCQLRKDFRRFHLDRMQDLVLTDISFRPRRVPMLRDYVALVRGTAPTAFASGLEP